ncbi:MAG: TusE/DsrC/DsvC family sulfur relay protein [Sedimenticola sp.]
MNTPNPAVTQTSAGLVPPGPEFDEDGFLINPTSWNKEVGCSIADQAGIGPLGEAHWKVILFLRDRYMRFGAIPPMRRICRGSALSRMELKQMFGGCLQVWRIAGLPNPGEEAKAYLS